MRNTTLQQTERETLQEAYRNHPKAHFRQRSHALLLSDSGKTVKEIASIFLVRTRTIYSWLNRWEDIGICGLSILPGRGLKPTLSADKPELVKAVKKNPSIFPQCIYSSR